jgi:hypothetical protein
MKAGRTLPDLAAEIQRQADSKRDFIAPTTSVTMTVDEAAMRDFERLMSKPVQGTRNGRSRRRGRRNTAQADQTPKITVEQSPVRIMGLDDTTDFGIRPVAHGQLAERIGIPRRYYDRMATEAPALLAENVNHWLHHSRENRMFRILDGNVRAVLSDRYQRLDYFDFFTAIWPILKPIVDAGDLHVESCQVTERKLYLKCVNQRLKGEVVGDVVQAGLVFSDSETGFGRINIQQMTYVLRCTNGMVGESVLGRAHLGGKQGSDSDRVEEMLQDDTKAMKEEVLWREVSDVTHAMLTDRDTWDKTLTKLNDAAKDKIDGDVPGAVVELQKATKITDKARSGILKHLIEGGDLSKWGVSQAVTRYAQDVEDYDEATELETLGHKVIEMPKRTWDVIANAEPQEKSA